MNRLKSAFNHANKSFVKTCVDYAKFGEIFLQATFDYFFVDFNKKIKNHKFLKIIGNILMPLLFLFVLTIFIYVMVASFFIIFSVFICDFCRFYITHK